MTLHDRDPMDERELPYPERGMLLGVCKNLSVDAGFPIWLTRVLAILAFLWVNIFAIVGYLVLFGLFYSRMPGARMRRHRVFKPARSSRLSRSGMEVHAREPKRRKSTVDGRRASLAQARKAMMACEARMQRMERYVTSDRFRFDQEFRTL